MTTSKYQLSINEANFNPIMYEVRNQWGWGDFSLIEETED